MLLATLASTVRMIVALVEIRFPAAGSVPRAVVASLCYVSVVGCQIFAISSYQYTAHLLSAILRISTNKNRSDEFRLSGRHPIVVFNCRGLPVKEIKGNGRGRRKHGGQFRRHEYQIWVAVAWA